MIGWSDVEKNFIGQFLLVKKQQVVERGKTCNFFVWCVCLGDLDSAFMLTQPKEDFLASSCRYYLLTLKQSVKYLIFYS